MQKPNFFFFFYKLVTKRYFKVNANWQIKNLTSFSSGCLVINCFFRSERKLTASQSISSPSPVCAGVWACAQLSNLPISPRDTAVSSQRSLLVRWAQEWASEQIVSPLPCSLGSGRVSLLPARPSRLTGQSLFDPAALRLSNANTASYRERNTTGLLSGFIPNVLHALSSFSY